MLCNVPWNIQLLHPQMLCSVPRNTDAPGINAAIDIAALTSRRLLISYDGDNLLHLLCLAIKCAVYPAPNPLSIFTTDTPEAAGEHPQQ